ncbi:WD40-repeat-containing domain protein [Flagelloscypha sp. PMI_526]|nr:WD40-repeat-containing domain protein [Flagelloscypha sp. PMI_526]
MSERRRAEIEAKKAKLEELKKQRIIRQNRGAGGTPDSRTDTPNIENRKKDLEDLVGRLIGETPGSSRRESAQQTPSSSMPGTPQLGVANLPGHSPSGRGSRLSDVGSGPGNTSGTDSLLDKTLLPRYIPDLVDLEQELFELPPKERVLYNKEIQTNAADSDEDTQGNEILLRLQLEKENAAERDRIAEEKELDAVSEQLDREIEREIRELSEEERASILAAPEFIDFVEQSTKFVQRVLSDPYDYTGDYTADTDGGVDDSEGKRVKRVCEFYDEHYTKNRSITDIDWSPKFPELSVASYNKNPAAINEPDGIVAVWNLRMLDRPEFVFHSQSDVLSVTFSPFHSNLVFGGTYSGQILLWDTRSKHLPVLKTPLSAAGHTHPVYAIRMVGTQNAHNLITTSTDGLVCSWLVDMLAQPQETLELIHTGHNKTGEVAITSLDFPDNETTTFWVGTEEGNVYQANRYDRAGSKAGLNQFDVYKGHFGPITGLHFHPLSGPVDFSDIFLTSSVDWTVKLWRAKSLQKPSSSANLIAPLYSFDEADDYVYDVRWHETHPAIFGTVDGTGKFDVWNLNSDTEVPAVSTSLPSGRAINKFRWDRKDGRRAALGGSDGRLYIYDIGDMAIPRETEWTDLQKTFAGMQSGSGGGGGQTNGTTGDDVRLLAGR